MDTMSNLGDNIKACRTCGIHFVTPSNQQLKHLFQSCHEHSEIMLIRLELAQWNVEVSENDGFPQYVCNTCVYKFEQVFQLRAACINAQNEFRKFYNVPNGKMPNIKIKSEVPDGEEEPSICDFIYVDELSDGEYDGATPFNIPHIPIKEEVIEAAAVPMDDLEHHVNVVESASRVVISTETEFVTHKDSAIVSQTDAILPVTSDVLECNLCHQLFSNQEVHKYHMKVVHDISDLECHVCGKNFKNSTSARLKFHMKWHNLNKQIKCNFCGFVCYSKETLTAHKRTNHRKTNCKICGKGVLAKKIKSHLHQHELQQKYRCEYCTKAFASENERETHIWGVHAAEDNSATSSVTYYTSQVNDNTSNVKPGVNLCQEQHENLLYKYICAHCEYRFITQLDLESHVKAEHQGFHSTTFEPKTAMIVDTPQTDFVLNFNERAVFEKYGDSVIPIANINDPPINSTIFTQEIHSTTTGNFVTPIETMQKDGTKVVSCSSSDEDYETTETADETSNLLKYDLNTFACAKCSETFPVIEQLREHHQQHLLAAEQNNPKISKFKCDFCEKTFNLKFRLNRHINKHKNHA